MSVWNGGAETETPGRRRDTSQHPAWRCGCGCGCGCVVASRASSTHAEAEHEHDDDDDDDSWPPPPPPLRRAVRCVTGVRRAAEETQAGPETRNQKPET